MKARPSVRRGWNAAPGTVSRRLLVDCPRCESPAGSRCYRLRSWVPFGDGEGFYAERQDGFHDERKALPVPAVEPSAEPSRGDLRAAIGSLVMRKLAGSDRMKARKWASATQRTAEELRERLAELEAMADLPW